LVKIIHIVAKKQVGDAIQTIFKQAFGPSSMVFDFDGLAER
jgi:Na+/alanine symporter